MKIIGFSGNAGAGKDTAYRLLSSYSVGNKKCTAIFHRAAFADPLKDCASKAFGIASEYFHVNELKGEIHEPWNVSARQIAQFLGTEMFRDTIKGLCPQVGNDFWVWRLRKDLETYDSNTIHCITDVRFQNEVDWILGEDINGIVIQLKRIGATGNVGIKDHISEAGYKISHKQGDRHYEVSNNSSTKDLQTNLVNIVEEHFDIYS